LRALERTPLALWDIADASRYVGVLGYALELVAVGTKGDRLPLGLRSDRSSSRAGAGRRR
jgi:hypothetical protein